MRVIMNQKKWDIVQSENMIDDLLKGIEQELKKERRHFSHIVVDGQEIYDYVEKYLEENYNSIDIVEIITKSINEFIQEVLYSIKDYLSRALPEVVGLANEFYQTPQAESWNKLAQLVDGLGWIMSGFDQIDKQKQLNEIITNYELWNETIKEVLALNTVFVDMDEGMKTKDYVLIADILAHEIQPVLEIIAKKVGDIDVQG